MSYVIHTLFGLTLLYQQWRKHRNDFIVKAVTAMLIPKKAAPSELDFVKAQRTASKTIVMRYEYQNQHYELVLPTSKRRKPWTKCYATMQDGSVRDVTDLVAPRSGPHGDFFGLKLKPEQVVRGATKFLFYDKNDRTVTI